MKSRRPDIVRDFPDLGVGVGLRACHMPLFLAGPVSGVDWVEVIAENFMLTGDRPEPRAALDRLLRVRAHTPVALHGVSLSLGSSTKTRAEFQADLQRWRHVIDAVRPVWVSEHLCWTGAHGLQTHDLLPLPYTREARDLVVDRIRYVQDALGRRILLENVSSYTVFEASEMSEWDFLSEVVERADCGLLLDLNNVFVSAENHGFSVTRYVNRIPLDRVGQIHLAGPSPSTVAGVKWVDTHAAPVLKPVWDLYREVQDEIGPVSAMIERDGNIPDWPQMSEELENLRSLRQVERELGRAHDVVS